MTGLGLSVVAEFLSIDADNYSLSDRVSSQDNDSYKFADMIRSVADGFVEMRLL